MAIKSLSEIKKELKKEGISIVRQNCKINGRTAYKIIGSKNVNEFYLFNGFEIKSLYFQGSL